MDLYPKDLGEQITRQVRQDRSRAPIKPKKEGLQPNSVGVCGLAGSAIATSFWMLNLMPFAEFLGAAALCCLGGYGYLSVRALSTDESTQRPLTAEEVQEVRQWAGDGLLQSYLDLAQSVISLPDTKDETANREVRDAITALGTAIEALPPEQVVVTDDPAALRVEAQTQEENAQGEGDTVIAASLRRRAESLLRRADTAAKTLLLLRRNRALRDEVGEQIKALRTSLTALQIGGRQSAPELSGLAASIHRVALEANAVTIARAEVDTFLSQPARSVEETEPQTVRLRM